ncbi:hypothetical protein LINGRAHAP2_LOCUS19551 [Linum grandiflorum]
MDENAWRSNGRRVLITVMLDWRLEKEEEKGKGDSDKLRVALQELKRESTSLNLGKERKTFFTNSLILSPVFSVTRFAKTLALLNQILTAPGSHQQVNHDGEDEDDRFKDHC